LSFTASVTNSRSGIPRAAATDLARRKIVSGISKVVFTNACQNSRDEIWLGRFVDYVWDTSIWRLGWSKSVRKCGLRRFNLHQCRFASG